MTTDDFTEAARAEADERYPIKPTAIRTVALHGRARADFADGAEWARTYIDAQEPTDAEVEAVASSILLSTTGRHWEDIDEGERREYRRYARAALVRARAARRNEENR